ncbi:MAG: hypothetical protein MJ211_06005 [Bacteroidales bacterium]|nr:hypothetical protein [Bacteroidales bacterium]
MKRFTEKFRTKLYDSVAEIENNSQAEAVVIIKKASANYIIYSFAASALIGFILYTFFMFAPFDIDPYIMYLFTVISFAVAMTLFTFIPCLQRLIIPKKIRRKNAEINARAIFQKGMIYNTMEHTGFLIYCSVLEKETVFMPDNGLNLIFSEDDMDKLTKMFENIFNAKDVPNEILRTMHESVPTFAKYLPHREDDINELPDNLDVDL